MANGHFLLFILRQREKSAISVRKKHKFQTENKTLHKMFGKTLDSGGKIRYNKGNVMTKCKGAVMMGSLSFRGQAVAGAHRSGDWTGGALLFA